jgi:hypothetical protein
MRTLIWVVSVVLASLASTTAFAADPSGMASSMSPSLLWGIPFEELLFSIAVFLLITPRFWHHRMGLVAAG